MADDDFEGGALSTCCSAFRSVLSPPSCPICADPLPRLGYLFPGLNPGGLEDLEKYSSAYDRPCCRQPVCTSCVHSHVVSVLSEGIAGGAGRTRLTCPMGCGSEISDGEVRHSIKVANWSWVHATIGALLFRMLLACGLLRQRDVTTKRNRRYRAWNYLTKCHEERLELRTYERWSLAVALVNREEGGEDHVMRCPAPDCDCIWFSSASYRRRKLENERRYDGPSSSNVRASRSLGGSASQSFLRAASTWLFYRPLRPDEELGGANSRERKRVIDDWVDAEHVDAFAFETRSQRSGGGRSYHEVARVCRRDRRDVRAGKASSDGRRVLCPRCKYAFCGLCSRPWNTFACDASGGGGSKRISHTGKLCSTYARRTIDPSEDDYAFAADAVDARACPGCSMRTERIDGCNHMTCACGTEWCYVCETRWNVRHYSCRDVEVDGNGGVAVQDGDEEGYCVIS